jgi:SAM-dependent methyltransferase
MEKKDIILSFDTISVLYDKIRPGYPIQAFEDILHFCNIDYNSIILDVGVGTGKAIHFFLENGYKAYCIDIGYNMIEIAKRNLSIYNAEFELADFESWETKLKFKLIISGSAFHWINPNIGYNKINSLLLKDGYFVTLKNVHSLENEQLSNSLKLIYQNIIPEWYSINYTSFANEVDDVQVDLYFNTIFRETYDWKLTYSSLEYIELIKTFSGHINLNCEIKNNLFKEIHKLIESEYNGAVIIKWQTQLLILQNR